MSSKKMVKRKGQLAQVNTSVGLQYRMDNIGHNIYKMKTDIYKMKTDIYKMKTELEFEIECPSCYDNMTLCSDFDGL